jgi:hypothetical protein
MKLLSTLGLALALGLGLPAFSNVAFAETKEEKVELTALPDAVKDGFKTAVPGGEIKSAKKLSGTSTRYQIKYSLDGKDHQITLGEDGKPTKGKKEEKKEEK